MELTVTQPESNQANQLVVAQPSKPPAIETQVSYEDFAVARLAALPVETKQIPNTGEGTGKAPGSYYQIPLMYSYGPDNNRIIDECLIECCEVTTKQGISSAMNQQGTRMQHNILTKFDLNDSAQIKFVETMGYLHAGACHVVGQMRGAVKLMDFDPQRPGGMFKSPIYRPRDEVTFEYIQGRAPSMYFKLFCGQNPTDEKTLFTGPDGKPVPWENLKGVEMKFIPLLRVKSIYCGGGKAALQMDVLSAVITKISLRNTESRQMGTIQRLKQERPEWSDMVSAQLAKITIARQDQLLGASGYQEPKKEGEDTQQPTYAGVTPTGKQPTLPGQSAPAIPGQLPVIPAFTAQPTIQEFTAGAPPRMPVIPAAMIPNTQANSPNTQSNTIRLG